MNGIWFLSPERNMLISEFNRIVTSDGVIELWVTEINKGSRKVATGEDAIKVEQVLLNTIWNSYPSIIRDNSGRIATNVAINQEENKEVE